LKRASKSRLPEILLDRSSAVPLYRQTYQAIARAIRSGILSSGTRLPSSRMMARLLGVSRNTVLNAYEELAVEDLITGRVGSGTQVHTVQVVQGRGIVDWRDWMRESRYPARTIPLTDADGNTLYLNY
jgi:DNA-binding GntR family transcriptional regulator